MFLAMDEKKKSWAKMNFLIKDRTKLTAQTKPLGSEISAKCQDSLSTKHKLQCKLKPNITQISQLITDGGLQILHIGLVFTIRLRWV